MELSAEEKQLEVQLTADFTRVATQLLQYQKPQLVSILEQKCACLEEIVRLREAEAPAAQETAVYKRRFEALVGSQLATLCDYPPEVKTSAGESACGLLRRIFLTLQRAELRKLAAMPEKPDSFQPDQTNTSQEVANLRFELAGAKAAAEQARKAADAARTQLGDALRDLAAERRRTSQLERQAEVDEAAGAERTQNVERACATRLKNVQREAEDLGQRLGESQRALREAQARGDELERRAKRADAEVAAKDAVVGDLRSALEASQQLLKSTAQTVQRLQVRLDESAGCEKTVSGELSAAMAEKLALGQRLELQREQIAKLDEIQQKQTAQEETIAELRADNVRLQAELDRAKTDKLDLALKLDASGKQNIRLEGVVASAARIQEQLSSELKMTKREVESQNQRLSEAAEELLSSHQALTELEEKNVVLRESQLRSALVASGVHRESVLCSSSGARTDKSGNLAGSVLA